MTRGKKIIIVVVALLGGGAALLVLLGVLAYRSFTSRFGPSEPPPELSEARVLAGAEFLTKTVFYRQDLKISWRDWLEREKLVVGLESNADLAVGELDGRPGLDVGLARTYGLTLLDRRGQVRERVNYQFQKGKVKISSLELERVKDSFHQQRVIDLEGDGVCEVMAFGGLDGLAVFNHQGNVVLSRGEYADENPSVQEVSAGDLDGDGKLEFVVSWGFQPAGLELLDHLGNSRWRQQEEHKPGPFEIVDVDGDGAVELVEQSGDAIKIRDARGKQLRTSKSPVYLWHLALCPGAEAGGPPQNIALREGSAWLTHFNDEKFTRLDAPLSKIRLAQPRVTKYPEIDYTHVQEYEDVYRAAGAWVRLKPGQPKYLAVAGEFAAMERAVLYVYDAQGKLVYHEVLPEQSRKVVALPQEGGGNGAEELLVVGKSTVWRYAAR